MLQDRTNNTIQPREQAQDTARSLLRAEKSPLDLEEQKKTNPPLPADSPATFQGLKARKLQASTAKVERTP